jgi:hypothetical protein
MGGCNLPRNLQRRGRCGAASEQPRAGGGSYWRGSGQWQNIGDTTSRHGLRNSPVFLRPLLEGLAASGRRENDRKGAAGAES